MPRKKYTEGQIALVVKELENGATEGTCAASDDRSEFLAKMRDYERLIASIFLV